MFSLFFVWKKKLGWKIFFNYKTIGFIIIWLNITLIRQRKIEVDFIRNKNFNMVILFLLVKCWMTWNMFSLEHWKNIDHFILSIKASVWRAYCFQTLLKMEPIGKEWGAHLVGGYLCAQPLLPVLFLSIVIVLLFNSMFSTSNITGKSIK